MLHVAAAERLASALGVAFDLCEERGAALSGVQKIALIEGAILEFDGFQAQAESLVAFDAFMRELGAERQQN
jgi:hypothetical protein